MTFSETQIAAFLASVFWPAVRISSMFLSMPLLSNQQVSKKVKILLAVAITWVVYPTLETPPVVDVFSAEALMIMVQQIAIGVLMGFMLQFAFGALAVAGEMVGYSMKLGMAKMADPINGVQVPIVTTLYFTLGMLVLLALDIHLVLIQLLIDSFSVFPVAVDGVTRNTLWEVIGWATRMFEIGVLMSLPIVGSILLLDISMGVVQRAAPQMHIFAIGFPITLIAGLLLIWLTLPEVFDVFVDSMNEILFFIRDVLFVRT